MPGSYSVSDIFRYFSPGFLIVFLIGITNKSGLDLVEKHLTVTVLFAFIIGTLFYNAYRYFYGKIRGIKSSPANKFLRNEFIEYIANKKNDSTKTDIEDIDIEDIYDKNEIFRFTIRHFVESDTNHMNYQNKIVSSIHLNYMNFSVLTLYVIFIVIAKYLCNKLEVFNYNILLLVLLSFLAYLFFMKATTDDKDAENQEKLFLMVQDIKKVFDKLKLLK